ncbi:MAG: valine--tRNA ligase [Endomicrobiia bacterium]
MNEKNLVLELPKTYVAESVEPEIYNYWVSKKFEQSIPDNKKPFVIVIPPPNITGALHMGHALNNTLQDVIIRYARMKGFNALWIPGTDHGGIATQNVVEKLLLKEKKTRHDLGREKFLEYMWNWRKKTGDTILNQLHKLGCSCDWSRTRFTMDEVCSSAVNKTFIKLFNEGYIYRGERIVNWCPRCHTAIADIEVEYKEEKSSLWYIRYPLVKSEKEQIPDYIVVATTRPETMLGDVAVAVNPKDDRYKNFIGKKIILPLMNREISIVSDELVDKEFGTGAVKVTPAHDTADFQIAQNHNLDTSIKVINEEGKMINVGKYNGMDRFECRKQVVADLESLGLIEKIEPYNHSVGLCYRCNTVIEPLVSDQWFVKMDKLAQKAISAIEEGKVVYYPENWKEHTLQWLKNIKDWCISRQIWWGHRIPVWYCTNFVKSEKLKDKSENFLQNTVKIEQFTKGNCPPIASVEKPSKCPNCGGTDFIQDPDVLDTWFSSALWPFSVLGWGILDETESINLGTERKNISYDKSKIEQELNYYYPTQVLVTGYEILYLWVARMIMMGLHFLNKVPFREVFVHGIVRDMHGKKMSKSLGNVIDPLEIVKQYGTDALRFSVVSSAGAGKDIHLSEETFVSARNFMNKIYNMTRFILMNIEEGQKYSLEQIIKLKDKMTIADLWILSELQMLITDVNKNYEKYLINTMSRDLYNFVWYKFCDWYIEIAKFNLTKSETEEEKEQKVLTMSILLYVLEQVLKLLHPIIPFFTEYMWQNLQNKNLLNDKTESMMMSKFPEKMDFEINSLDAKKFELIENIVTEVRFLRNEFKIPHNIKPEIIISAKDDVVKIVKQYENYILRLGWLSAIKYNEKKPFHSTVSVIKISSMGITLELNMLLEGIIDIEKEKTRLKKEYDNIEKFIQSLEQKLTNEQFLSKAPKEEVDKIKERHKLSKESLEKLKQFIFNLDQ